MAVRNTCHAFGFLFKAPLILLFLFVVNWMTYTGEWWFKWAALGIGIAWVISLFRVLRAVILAGGLAALAGYVASRR
jgi:Sec-independent protein secretion pathway component TatC